MIASLTAPELREEWLLVHIAGVLVFVLAHGVSAGVGLRLRKEREPGRIDALLQLSSTALRWMYLGLLLLLAGGILSGFVIKAWRHAWIWVALGTLVAEMIAMYVIATRYYQRVRKVLQMRLGAESATEDVASVMSSTRPIVLAVVGYAGLFFIAYLMVFKPF